MNAAGNDAPGQRYLVPIDDPHLVIRCRRCGRPLRTTESKKHGMGRTCRKRSAETETETDHAETKP